MTSAEHDELRDQIGPYVLGALTSPERVLVESHVATCPECAADVRALRTTADALAWSVPAAEPPAGVRTRVLTSVAASSAVERSEHRYGRMPWLAAAAALVMAAGLGVYAEQLRQRVQVLEGQLREAVVQVEASARRTAQARLIAANAERELAVLAAPDVAHVDLKGQASAPQASARALWSRSRGLLLAVSNLPAPPLGRTYQLWVLSGRAAPISDGWVFKTDASGTATAMFTTPLSLPAPTAMAVTIEPDGGTSAPTGAMYLVGSLN
jgi:anti-sigma-K factor RskA